MPRNVVAVQWACVSTWWDSEGKSMRSVFERRLSRVLMAAGLLTAVLAVPAVATPDDGTGHSVEICHVTNSASNEFIVITIDRAAFDGGDASDHEHHTNRFGNSDHLYDPAIGCYATSVTTTTSGPED